MFPNCRKSVNIRIQRFDTQILLIISLPTICVYVGAYTCCSHHVHDLILYTLLPKVWFFKRSLKSAEFCFNHIDIFYLSNGRKRIKVYFWPAAYRYICKKKIFEYFGSRCSRRKMNTLGNFFFLSEKFNYGSKGKLL